MKHEYIKSAYSPSEEYADKTVVMTKVILETIEKQNLSKSEGFNLCYNIGASLIFSALGTVAKENRDVVAARLLLTFTDCLHKSLAAINSKES
jgi:hypothetical protein